MNDQPWIILLEEIAEARSEIVRELAQNLGKKFADVRTVERWFKPEKRVLPGNKDKVYALSEAYYHYVLRKIKSSREGFDSSSKIEGKKIEEYWQGRQADALREMLMSIQRRAAEKGISAFDTYTLDDLKNMDEVHLYNYIREVFLRAWLAARTKSPTMPPQLSLPLQALVLSLPVEAGSPSAQKSQNIFEPDPAFGKTGFAWPQTEAQYANRLNNLKKAENRKDLFRRMRASLPHDLSDLDFVTINEKGRAHSVPAVYLQRWGYLPEDQISIINESSHEYMTDPDNDLVSFLKDVLKKNIYNDQVYKLTSFPDDSSYGIGLTDYVSLLKTCDSFLYKLVCSFPEEGVMTDAKWEQIVNMDFYQGWLDSLRTLATGQDLPKMKYGMACSCAVLFKVKDGDGCFYQTIAIVNSLKKNAVENYHIIPSFMYQPGKSAWDSDFAQEASIRNNILREYAEEILGLEEAADVSRNSYIVVQAANNPAFRDLLGLIQNGQARMFVSGMVFDFLRLRPEIISLLVIDDETYLERHRESFELNWETGRYRSTGMKPVREIDFTKGLEFSDVLRQAKILDNELSELPFDFVSPGLTALYHAYLWTVKEREQAAAAESAQ